VIWKEPLVVRQRFTQLPEFQLRRWLKLSLLMLFSAPLVPASVFALHLHWPGWQRYVSLSLYFSGVGLLCLFVSYGVFSILHKFEATYSVDHTGIKIQKAGSGRVLLWRFIRSLEIVPHPTIENIGLLRCVYQAHWVIGKSDIEEIPFESGQIDLAVVTELYKEHGPK
jgi:hypothetical protein